MSGIQQHVLDMSAVAAEVGAAPGEAIGKDGCKGPLGCLNMRHIPQLTLYRPAGVSAAVGTSPGNHGAISGRKSVVCVCSESAASYLSEHSTSCHCHCGRSHCAKV